MTDDQAFIAERQAAYVAAYPNVEAVMDFIPEDFDYSEYSFDKLHMDKATFAEFTKYYFSICEGIEFKTIAVNGTKAFVAWEWEVRFTVKADSEHAKKGEKCLYIGTSVMHWEQRGGHAGFKGWQCVKCGDYSVPKPAQT